MYVYIYVYIYICIYVYIYIYIHASSFSRWFLGCRTVKHKYSKGFALGGAIFHRWAFLVQKQRFYINWTCRGNMGNNMSGALPESPRILSSPDAQQSSGSKVNISLNFTWNFLSRVQSRTVVRKTARGGHETSTLLLGTGSKAIQT